MLSRVDLELVLFLNSCTGEIVIKGISCDYERTIEQPDSIREYCNG